MRSLGRALAARLRGRPPRLCNRPLFTGYTRDEGLRDGDNRRRALCLSARRGGKRRGACPLAVCRPDRLAFAGDCRRRRNAGALWLWRRRPYRGANCKMAGSIGLCLHPTGRSSRPRPSPEALGADMGGRIRRDAAGAARCRDHLSRPWAISCLSRSRRSAKADVSFAPAST